jgi:hypothetical protein
VGVVMICEGDDAIRIIKLKVTICSISLTFEPLN